jgi:hypothetical protein
VILYLSGVTNDRIEPRLITAGIGLMCQPGNSYHLRIARYPFWAADVVGMHASATPERGMDWVAPLSPERCLFVVSPDAYPDAVESQRRGLEYAPLIRELGFPVAVVAQDGAERLSWPWDEMDCLFIGGIERRPGWTEWKESMAAEGLAHAARNAGKWVHMGRVNTRRRLRRARDMGCLSADGTGIKYRKRRRAGEDEGQRHSRGEGELIRDLGIVDATPSLPFHRWETPSHPNHRSVGWDNG